MAAESPHTVSTLHERINALLMLMDERDRRYSENRLCDQDAVKLAAEVAEKARGKVNVSLLIGASALILAIVREFR